MLNKERQDLNGIQNSSAFSNISSNSTKEEKGTVGLTEQELNAHIIHGNFLNIIF